MKLIVYQNVDTEVAIPAGGLILWAGLDAPEGWTFNTDFDDCFVMGGSALDLVLKGAVDHVHTMPDAASGGAHSDHSVTVSQSGQALGSAVALASNLTARSESGHRHTGTGTIYSAGAHTHTNPNTLGGSSLPPFVRMRWIEGGEVVPVGGVMMRNSSSGLPSGWMICDGTNGSPDMRGKFVYGGSGDPGGVEKHKHSAGGTTGSAGSHNHTVNVTSSDYSPSKNTSPNNATVSASISHSHNATVSSEVSDPATHTHSVGETSEDSVLPPFVQVFYIMRLS